MRYPVMITRDDNRTFLVTFPDVPGAITYGDTVEDALRRAPDALLTVFDALMKDRRDIPSPTHHDGPFVEVPALETAKIELYRTMRDAGIGKAALAKRLDWHMPQVDRVIDVHHASKLDQLEAAFAVLGKQLRIQVVNVAEERAVVSSRRARRRPVHGAIVTAASKSRAVGAGRAAAAASRGMSRKASKKR